ncbi:MAG TPA: hypothetical protein VGL82_19260 [Bryobacteraceae bacterium]
MLVEAEARVSQRLVEQDGPGAPVLPPVQVEAAQQGGPRAQAELGTLVSPARVAVSLAAAVRVLPEQAFLAGVGPAPAEPVFPPVVSTVEEPVAAAAAALPD